MATGSKLGICGFLVFSLAVGCSDDPKAGSRNSAGGAGANAGSSSVGGSQGGSAGSSSAGSANGGSTSGASGSANGGTAGDGGESGDDGTSGDGGAAGDGGSNATGGSSQTGGTGGASGAGGEGGGSDGGAGDCTVYASTYGTNGAPGTKDHPVRTLGEAVTIAAGQSVRGTVCACTNGFVNDFYDGDITIPNGVSVIGSFVCSTWQQNTTTHRTRFLGVMRVGEGAGRSTRFGSFFIDNPVYVNQASPTIFDLTGYAGVSMSGNYDGPRSHPLVRDCDFYGDGSGVWVEDAAPEIVNVSVRTESSSTATYPTIAALGASGNVDGMIIRGGSYTTIPPSNSNFNFSTAYAATISDCTGAVTVDGVNLTGSLFAFGNADGQWTGLQTSGPDCHVHVIGSDDSAIVGCSEGRNCTGIDCSGPCEIENAYVVGALSVLGSSGGDVGISCVNCGRVSNSEIVGCEEGVDVGDNQDCRGVDLSSSGSPDPLPLFENNSIRGADRFESDGDYSEAVGIYVGAARFVHNRVTTATELLGSGIAVYEIGGMTDTNPPVFEGNRIDAGGCSSGSYVTAIYGYANKSRFYNNVVTDRPSTPDCAGAGGVVLANISTEAADPEGPIFANNTFVYTRAAGTSRTGLTFTSVRSSAGPKATFVNNIFVNLSSVAAGYGYTVQETGTTTEPLVFTHNLLHDVGTSTQTGAFLYVNEGVTATPLTTLDALNALYGDATAGNAIGDPGLNATDHLAHGSPCVNAGQASLAPSTDIDGESRPRGAGIDLGADEAE